MERTAAILIAFIATSSIFWALRYIYLTDRRMSKEMKELEKELYGD